MLAAILFGLLLDGLSGVERERVRNTTREASHERRNGTGMIVTPAVPPHGDQSCLAVRWVRF